MIYLLFLLFTLAVFLIALYQIQYFLIFSPVYYREDELEDDFELLYVNTDDGVELEGVVYEPKNIDKRESSNCSTILFFAGRSHDSVGLIKKLANSFPQSRIITFNYRSYGKSQGVVNEKNIFSDALKIAQLVQKNYGNFYVVGYSLGSVVASFVASKKKISSLFLIGSFDSIALLSKEKYGVNLSMLLRYKFNNIELVESIEEPTYLFVSSCDEITYIANARNLKKHIKNLAFYSELDKLTHKELLWSKEVREKINEVIF